MLGFLVLLLLSLPLEESMASLNSDGYALLSFKQSISEDPEDSLSNWNSSDENPCAWNGVTCKDLAVVSLSIPKKKLFGFVPSELGSISGLRHLNLRNNRLFGNLPSELFSAAKGLQSLVLYGNSLSGDIPAGLAELKYLQTLDISGNFFNGSFPEFLTGCKRLRTLDLSRNNLTGALPVGFFGAGFASLENLDLSFNGFNGSLPGDIGNLTGLRGTVDFSHNLFSGEIPASLGSLPEKVYIDLTFNNLTGPIPQTGALMNRGPTAFIGNPNLCGPPLKIPCSAESPSSSLPYFPANNPPPPPRGKKARGLSKSSVIAIVVSDAIGICLLGLLFSFCYSKSCPRRENIHHHDDHDPKKKRQRKRCFWLSNGSPENLSADEDDESHHGLVSLDSSSSSSIGFDLDELLKASAFVLGKSGIGIVYKVVLEDGRSLAVRRLGEGGSQRLREFQTEVEAVGKLRHQNVATLKAYYWSVDEKLLIYDYVPNGNLSTAIHGKPGTVTLAPLSWPLRLKIMKGMARGLLYIHEFSPKKYVHGDLKPTNILLDHNMEPRISDFGLGRLADIAAGASGRTAGEKHPSETNAAIAAVGSSSSYVAPEAMMIKTVKPSQKWDVYSYGVILLEMITGRSPTVHVGPSEIDLVRWIEICVDEKKNLSEILDPCLDADKDEEIVGVIKIAMACVQTSPEKRPLMRQISEALERI